MCDALDPKVTHFEAEGLILLSNDYVIQDPAQRWKTHQVFKQRKLDMENH